MMKLFFNKTLILPLLAMSVFGCMKGEKETLKIPPGSYSIEINAVQSEPFALNIEANFLWTIECTASWLNFSPSKSVGDRQVLVSASPNTTLEVRRATFFIVGSQVREEFIVVQKGEDPSIVLHDNALSLSSNGGEVEVVLETNVDLEVSQDVSWITLNTTKLMGTNHFFFSVKQNTSLSSRTGKITFLYRSGQMSQVYTITQTGEEPEILLSTNNLSFDAEGGIKGVEVTANIAWKVMIESDKTWVKSIEGMQTKLMETSSCLFSIDKNPMAELREATVFISREGASEPVKLLTITQHPAVPEITFSPDSFLDIPSSGTQGNQKLTIDVEANFVWTADHGQTAGWITDVTFDAQKVTFKVSPNQAVSSRTTQIVFKQIDGNFTQSYDITQTGAAPMISIDYPVSNLQAIPEPIWIFVTSNVPWDYTVSHSWLEVMRGEVTTEGSSHEYLRCTASENTGTSPRTATITLENELITKVVNITQLAGAPFMTLSDEVIEMLAQESSVPITVTANVPWSHIVNAGWIAVKPAPVTKAALSDSTILISVEKNTSLLPREGEITFKQANGALQKKLQVVQAGASPTYTITPADNKRAIHGTGDDLTLIIDANFTVSFLNVDAPSWVEYKGVSTDRRLFHFTIKPTTFKEYRMAEITFKSADSDYQFRYSVVQKGATVSTTDSLVLLRLYTGLSGVVWRDRWNLNDPVLSWHGITLSDVIRAEDGVGKPGERLVTGISLPSNTLLGALEGGIIVQRIPLEELAFLQYLDLSGNFGLNGELPVRLRELKYLKELDLSNCSFSNTSTGRNIPAEWGGSIGGIPCFSSLSKLKIDHNSLSGQVPSSVIQHNNWSIWNASNNILPQRNGLFLTLPATP